MEQIPLLYHYSYHQFKIIHVPHIRRLHRDIQAAPSVFKWTLLPLVMDQQWRGIVLHHRSHCPPVVHGYVVL